MCKSIIANSQEPFEELLGLKTPEGRGSVIGLDVVPESFSFGPAESKAKFPAVDGRKLQSGTVVRCRGFRLEIALPSGRTRMCTVVKLCAPTHFSPALFEPHSENCDPLSPFLLIEASAAAFDDKKEIKALLRQVAPGIFGPGDADNVVAKPATSGSSSSSSSASDCGCDCDPEPTPSTVSSSRSESLSCFFLRVLLSDIFIYFFPCRVSQNDSKKKTD